MSQSHARSTSKQPRVHGGARARMWVQHRSALAAWANLASGWVCGQDVCSCDYVPQPFPIFCLVFLREVSESSSVRARRFVDATCRPCDVPLTRFEVDMEMDMDTCIARHENRELGALCVWSVEAAPWPMRHEHGDTHKSQMEMANATKSVALGLARRGE